MRRGWIRVFGTDYPTPDGTCIRDYIHVTDLADAHVLALNSLSEGSEVGIYNLGNGMGFSVRQVIRAAEEVAGMQIIVVESERRQGDPAVLIASADRAKRDLGWRPRYDDLKTIITTAWNWHSKHPNGFAGV